MQYARSSSTFIERCPRTSDALGIVARSRQIERSTSVTDPIPAVHVSEPLTDLPFHPPTFRTFRRTPCTTSESSSTHRGFLKGWFGLRVNAGRM